MTGIARWLTLAPIALLTTGCLITGGGNGPNGQASPTPGPTATPEPPGGALTFSSVSGYNDRITGVLSGLDPLAEGQVYAAWLLDDAGGSYLQITTNQLNDNDLLLVSYTDGDGSDLLAEWSAAEVSIEEDGNVGNAPAGEVVLAGAISDADLLTYSRELLSDWSGGSVPPVHALVAQAELAEEHVHVAEDEMVNNDDPATSLDFAEKVYNLMAGEYAAIDLEGDASVDMGGGDPIGVLPSDDGMGASHDGFLKITLDLVDQAIANLPSDAPAREAGQAVITECEFRTRRSANSTLAAGLAIQGAPSPELEDFAAVEMHQDVDEVRGFAKSCILDGIKDMASIYVAAP